MNNKFTTQTMKKIMKLLDTNPKVKEYVDQMLSVPLEPKDPLPLKKPTLSAQPVEPKSPIKPKKS